MDWISNLQYGITMMGGGAPSYTPPPAAPPAAAPPTLASSSVAQSAVRQRNAQGAALADVGTSAEGIAPTSVNTARTTLGGTS